MLYFYTFYIEILNEQTFLFLKVCTVKKNLYNYNILYILWKDKKNEILVHLSIQNKSELINIACKCPHWFRNSLKINQKAA